LLKNWKPLIEAALLKRFKIEGKAEKSMKECLAALRNH